MDGTLDAEPFVPPRPCALCHRVLSSGNEDLDIEAISICADCKFLFLEDNVTLSPLLDALSPQDIRQRTPRVRRTRYGSSESMENIFPQQFSSMINLARLYQTSENRSVDSGQRTSSRTTPSGSRRWRRGLSDTESDGFDSVYGESDVYGGYSDASVDGHSFLDVGSGADSDTDIDPMHAGLNQWSSDDDDDNDEWEEVEAGENTLGSLIARVQLQRSDGQNPAVNWPTEIRSPEIEGVVRVRVNGSRPNMVDQETSTFVGNSGDYLDARSFEELLERLAEADGSRRGAPPAAVSFVNNLERVVVNEEEHNGLACAVCKESFCVGIVVNQLPCLHLYHPWCIKPWLSSRNSCPLCRYEVPTDDRDYESTKQSGSHGSRVREQEEQYDASDEEDEIVNLDNRGRGGGRWWLVAAPVASVVGIGLALWLGSPGGIQISGGQRGDRSRRWWCMF